MRGLLVSPTTGICGDSIHPMTGYCYLPAGHRGWHRSEAGASWSITRPPAKAFAWRLVMTALAMFMLGLYVGRGSGWAWFWLVVAVVNVASVALVHRGRFEPWHQHGGTA